MHTSRDRDVNLPILLMGKMVCEPGAERLNFEKVDLSTPAVYPARARENRESFL